MPPPQIAPPHQQFPARFSRARGEEDAPNLRELAPALRTCGSAIKAEANARMLGGEMGGGEKRWDFTLNPHCPAVPPPLAPHHREKESVGLKAAEIRLLLNTGDLSRVASPPACLPTLGTPAAPFASLAPGKR